MQIRHVSLMLAASLVSAAAAAETLADFKLTEEYVQLLGQTGGATISLQFTGEHRTKTVHTLQKDCEMHIAGNISDVALGQPESLVAEPPNLCKFAPRGTWKGKSWGAVLDQLVIGKDCKATGFPRIYTEHAAGEALPANPNHVFELHPLLDLDCGGSQLSFRSMLKVFPGMAAIKPASAKECVDTYELKVRWHKNFYEFAQTRSGKCGNFAIIEVGFVEPEWIRAIPDGHTAIARVSLDGGSRNTLKLYTFSGSKPDQWLSDTKTAGTMGKSRVLLHGMFTVDYFSIVKALRDREGTWSKPQEWTDIEYPLAFVVFGESKTGPGEEDD